MLINGKTPDGTESLNIINPATGASFAKVARASAEHINAAVAAAKAAQPGWAARPLLERQKALSRLADYIHANEADITSTLVMEQGKPIEEATAEVGYARFSSAGTPDRSWRPTSSKMTSSTAFSCNIALSELLRVLLPGIFRC